jgi:hypothetical protein
MSTLANLNLHRMEITIKLMMTTTEYMMPMNMHMLDRTLWNLIKRTKVTGLDLLTNNFTPTSSRSLHALAGRCHHESNWTGLVDKQLHPDLLKVPARPGGGQDGDGHRDDSSEAVLSGEASGMEYISIWMLQINREHSWVVLCLFHLFFSYPLCFLF